MEKYDISYLGDLMRKFIICFLVVSLMLCGCEKKEDRFSYYVHEDLLDKIRSGEAKTFTFVNNGVNSTYVVIKCANGVCVDIYYKLSDNDYILLKSDVVGTSVDSKLWFYQDMKNNLNKFYTLYHQHAYEYVFDKEKVKENELRFDLSSLVESAEDLDHEMFTNMTDVNSDYIYFDISRTWSGKYYYDIKCSLKTLVCERNE